VRINIGVIAFDEKRVLTRCLANWTRVKAFGNVDEPIMRGLSSEIENASDLWPKGVIEMAEQWSHSLQLTNPRASTFGHLAIVRSEAV